MAQEVTERDTLQEIEKVLIGGDLSGLSTAERISYYNRVCDSLGLNKFTAPFQYIRFQGKLTLYAKRDCTDQLRKIHNISLAIVSRTELEDTYEVIARATMPSGRFDEDEGSVPLSKMIKGEARSNAKMKAVTKAKRRVTLSICGLGLLDQTEVDTIDGAKEEPIDMVPDLEKTNGNQADNPEDPKVVQGGGEDEASPAAEDDAGGDEPPFSVEESEAVAERLNRNLALTRNEQERLAYIENNNHHFNRLREQDKKSVQSMSQEMRNKFRRKPVRA